MKSNNFVAINGASAGSTVYSNAIDAQSIFAFSVVGITSGSPTGTLKVQCSNDPCPSGNLPGAFQPVNWADVPSATIAISAAGVVLIPKFDSAYRWLRIGYIFGSGTGTISAGFNALEY